MIALENSSQEMKQYYNQRAREYENIYFKPERREDIQTLEVELQRRLRTKDVLELACGTGYWTRVISKTARSILASDQSAETLRVAKAKALSNVTFVQDDAFELKNASGDFNVGFAGFWWSHIPKSRYTDFLSSFGSKLSRGASVIFIDNTYVEGSSTPISRRDEAGNTFQIRQLQDGSTYEVLKNFPDDSELRESFSAYSQNLEILRLKYFWLVEVRLSAN